MASARESNTPFHPGETAIQERLGVRDSIEPWASKVVRSWLPAQHREFYAQLPFIVASARDRRGRPWVTLLTGVPGFVESPRATEMVIGAHLISGDALEGALRPAADLGLLGIDLETRRRNRVNGTITANGPDGLRFAVGQSFGNCPQYITERAWQQVTVTKTDTEASRHIKLTAQMQRLIRRADTFFIGSGYRGAADHASNGMDVSHRGGPVGFVKVESPTQIVFPDFAGNNHFNTLGNLALDPRVAVTFVDFGSGDMLQLSGKATIDWDSPAVAEHAGAQRLVIIDIDEVVALSNALPLRFSEPKGLVRELRLVDRKRESEDVVSFVFASRDGGALSEFEAGQHLPVEVDVGNTKQTLARTYSLSGPPSQSRYRISVKRETGGLVSNYLHDNLEVGSVLSSRQPGGDFTLDNKARPVMLIGAGIGVTPLLSMLHQLVAEGPGRNVTLLHGVRDGRHHPFAAEVRQLVHANERASSVIAYSSPLPSDKVGRDFDFGGRIDKLLLRQTVSDNTADFYLCGPATFMNAVTEALLELGVTDEQIHVEQF